MAEKAAEQARAGAQIRGHIVDPVARQRLEANPSATPLSDALSDSEADCSMFFNIINARRLV